MIVRILGDSSYELPDEILPALEQLDGQMTAALDSGDEDSFSSALANLVSQVRSAGARVADHEVEPPSDLVVPHEGSTLHEVKTLLEQRD